MIKPLEYILYISIISFKENILFLCEMDRREKKKKREKKTEKGRVSIILDVSNGRYREGIIVHGSPSLPPSLTPWGCDAAYRMDAKDHDGTTGRERRNHGAGRRTSATFPLSSVL